MSPISGTQSPPLEATGEHTVMGASSVDNPNEKHEVVPDIKQREQYFEDESSNKDSSNDQKSGNKPAFKSQTIGQKLAEEGRQID